MDSKGPGPAAKVLDLQNGTKGRCRDGQRGLVEKIEALEGDKEAGGGQGGVSDTRLGCGNSAQVRGEGK